MTNPTPMPSADEPEVTIDITEDVTTPEDLAKLQAKIDAAIVADLPVTVRNTVFHASAMAKPEPELPPVKDPACVTKHRINCTCTGMHAGPIAPVSPFR